MPVHIICKLDEDLVKTEVTIIGTMFPHYMSMGD